MSTFAQTLVETASAVARFGADVSDYEALSDERLLELASVIAAHEKAFGLVKAQHAAQVARRSRREFGHSGLAARNGFASPQKFLQHVGNVTAREAGQLIAVGSALGEAEAARELLESGITQVGGAPVELPWDAPISDALAHGRLSVDGADALRRGLGEPTEAITVLVLAELAERLLRECSTFSPDRLFKAARIERELLDLDGIQSRESEHYERGGLKLSPQPDGMWRLSGQLDPESAAVLNTALDPFTSPRRGGPRFTRTDDIARAQAIVDDPRTTERLALDGLLELVKLGSSVDPATMHPKMGTLVKIVTTVDSGARGFGVLEGNGEVVSAATVERSLCDGNAVEVKVDCEGNPLDLGRSSRLFDRRQREALAVRDGGCIWPGCDRPPAFTEAHHIRQWKRDRGKTDIADGVLLCRFHHLQLHNNHWEIGRRGSEYWLTPPRAIDPDQTPICLKTKSPLIEHLRRRRTG